MFAPSRISIIARLLVLCALLTLHGTLGWTAPSGFHLRPNRVLVVASVQMRDNRVIRDAWDFGDIIALLKLWGIPFDVLRLDIHAMTPRDFHDATGHPRYSTIIWTARSHEEHPWQAQEYRVVQQAVARDHLGLIAVGNKIQEPVLQALLGLHYEQFSACVDPVTITSAPHFITRGLAGAVVPATMAFDEGGPQVTVTAPDVTVLAQTGNWPQATARTIDAPSCTRAVWIGGDPDYVFHNTPLFITLLRRALVWTQGYALYKDYQRTMVLRMDDPGSAQAAYFTGWDYQHLDAAAIRESIIAPLQAHHASLGVAVCPAFPWLPTRTLRHSASVDLIDPRGVRQNIASCFAGLRAGQHAGVLEIQSHGLTHMPPDLDTAPPAGTSWWKGRLKDEWDDERWYREFYDMRRDREVSAAVQRGLLRQSASWITQDFGQRPLTFVPGGHAISGDWFVEGSTRPLTTGGRRRISYQPPHIADTYTYLAAARAGYGLALDTSAHYLGRDYVIALTPCTAQEMTENFARGVPAVCYFHDRDLAQDPKYLVNLLARFGDDVAYLSMDAWTGYLHAQLDVHASPATLSVTMASDREYGRYFRDHAARWTLHLADDLRQDARQFTRVAITVDGHAVQTAPVDTVFPETQLITFPPGAGRHTVCFTATH